MRAWGWGILSLGALLVAFHQWMLGFAFVIIGLVLALSKSKKKEDEKAD